MVMEDMTLHSDYTEHKVLQHKQTKKNAQEEEEEEEEVQATHFL